MTPIKPMTMREYDQTMQKLKNENWDLKLRLFTIEGRGEKVIVGSRGDHGSIQSQRHIVGQQQQKVVVHDVGCQMIDPDVHDVSCQFDNNKAVVVDIGFQQNDHIEQQVSLLI